MFTTPMPSFDRARYPGDPAPPDACAYCSRDLGGSYYRVRSHLACSACAQQAESLVPPDSHKAYSKALLYGMGAAVVGCIGYAVFEITTGIMLGYIAIAVGYLVGWAMKRGSSGLGGRRYQITAALLTYAAVAVAFVPVAMHERDGKNHGVHQTATQSADANAAGNAEQRATQDTGSAPKPQSHGLGSFLLAIMMLLGLGLISPFLMIMGSPGQGLLNLFIIFLGVRFAWKAMVSPRVDVDGPYTMTPSHASEENVA